MHRCIVFEHQIQVVPMLNPYIHIVPIVINELIFFSVVADWVVMDMLGMENNQMGRLRYILKDELKYLPMFGLYFWQVD